MLAFLITVLLVFLQGATALFEDQAGKFDWMQRYVGRVDYLYWDQSHYMGKRLLVGTDKNALAAINVHNGSIAWRQILEEGEKGRINTLLHQGNGLVSVSGNGKFVRSWIPSSGFLQWETVLKHDPSSVATAVFVGNRRVESIAVLSGEILFNLKPTDGSEIFKVLLPDSDTVKYRHLHSIDRESYIVGVVAESHVVVVVVNGEGKIKTKTTVNAPWLKADTSCLITSDNLVCHDSTSMSIQTLVLLGGDTFIPTLLTDVSIKDSVIALEKAGHEISSVKSGIFVCRLQSGFIGLLKVGSNGLVTTVNTSPRLLSAQMTRHGDKQVLFTLESIDTEIVKMSGVDISTGSSLKDLSHKITYSKSYGQPLRCDALLFTKKDGHIGYKAIIRSEDYTLHLVHKAGRIAWRREEALAYILAVEMVDLPVSESQANFCFFFFLLVSFFFFFSFFFFLFLFFFFLFLFFFFLFLFFFFLFLFFFCFPFFLLFVSFFLFGFLFFFFSFFFFSSFLFSFLVFFLFFPFFFFPFFSFPFFFFFFSSFFFFLLLLLFPFFSSSSSFLFFLLLLLLVSFFSSFCFLFFFFLFPFFSSSSFLFFFLLLLLVSFFFFFFF
ncbi:EMC1 [Acanthosepion pharaonis]|uniref:EMC1 n=1 Tax=Acanthosepion pharaonis TaxID=158019 RepID=A0A812EKP5_ACAPH|nr:EMC1 [Sepia pharaonis]